MKRVVVLGRKKTKIERCELQKKTRVLVTRGLFDCGGLTAAFVILEASKLALKRRSTSAATSALPAAVHRDRGSGETRSDTGIIGIWTLCWEPGVEDDVKEEDEEEEEESGGDDDEGKDEEDDEERFGGGPGTGICPGGALTEEGALDNMDGDDNNS